jgi:hypothetical protein
MRDAWMLIMRILHAVSLYVLGAAAIAAVALTGLAVLGVLPWLSLTLVWGDLTLPDAGLWVQVALTGLLVALAAFIPASARVLALEATHRNFHISMQDVARAYAVAHAADRAGVFRLSSEFDAVRERIDHLRRHPDMAELEAGVMTAAAQMSQQSAHLARTYSDEAVDRARAFLEQRQTEAAAQEERIVAALATCREIRRWAEQVELEEAMVASRLRALDEELQSVLPLLGYGFETVDDPPAALPALAQDNVVALPSAPARARHTPT